MNKKKLSVLISAGLTASLTLGNVQTAAAESFNTQIVNEVTQSLVNSSKSIIEKTSDSVYLSEIEYDASKSGTGYGPIKKDVNVNGGTIRLRVDGEAVSFEKGMAAHATSTLVYDVSAYKDTYNRFISYVGIDYSQSGFGNGVNFSIYTSIDGNEWKVVKDLGLISSSGECAYVDINLNGANYIKLYANDNGSNGNDHAVYGDAKLVKAGYGGEAISGDILKEVSVYDEVLRASGIDENLAINEMTILRRDFVNKIGYDSIRRLASSDKKYRDAIEYLMTDITALRYFVTGGPVNIEGSYTASVKFFADIYEKYSAELKSGTEDNFNLRMAVSISLAYGKEELSKFWEGSDKERSSVARYEAYKEMIASGRMDEGGSTTGGGKWSSAQFKALPVTLMRWAVDNRINDDEILWLADYALSEKAKGKDYFDAYNYIKYTDGYDYSRDSLYDETNHAAYNEKYNFDGYFSDYGTRSLRRLWMIFEEGSVCGGLAKTYSNLADTFGRPSSVVGQPGHAATITYDWNSSNKRYEWMIQNDISGWTESGNEYTDRMLRWGNQSFSKWFSASYAVLATDAVLDYENYVKAAELNILAQAYSSNADKKKTYLKALEYQEINFDSFEGLINTYKNDSSLSSRDYFELSKRIIDAYTYYPQAMVELLELIKVNITEPSQMVEFDMLMNNALIRASKATAAESSCVLMTKQLAAYYLGSVSTELADFSFDGENAGMIVINSKYDGSKIRIKYSLDGGTTWADTDEHVIALTEEQIASINSSDDIQIGLVGGTDIFTIDIMDSRVITDSSIYRNDNENLLLGDTKNLELSLDGGMTWCNYVPGLENGTRITGNRSVLVRYKANGHYLTGASKEYTFTEDTDFEQRRYIQLKNVTLVGYSSQQNNTENAAANLIDGNGNTGWHTRFGFRETDKFFTVSFDKVRYITALEYTPGGWNGKIKSAEVYSSLDGTTWTKSGSISDMSGTTVNLDKPTACRFLKLVATETYGNSSGEANMYFSGKMLDFYEDTTKTYEAEAVIEYSNTEKTDKAVTAKLVLPEGCTIEGLDSYVFNNNGSYTFEFLDANSIKKTVTAMVDWIKEEAAKDDSDVVEPPKADEDNAAGTDDKIEHPKEDSDDVELPEDSDDKVVEQPDVERPKDDMEIPKDDSVDIEIPKAEAGKNEVPKVDLPGSESLKEDSSDNNVGSNNYSNKISNNESYSELTSGNNNSEANDAEEVSLSDMESNSDINKENIQAEKAGSPDEEAEHNKSSVPLMAGTGALIVAASTAWIVRRRKRDKRKRRRKRYKMK